MAVYRHGAMAFQGEPICYEDCQSYMFSYP